MLLEKGKIDDALEAYQSVLEFAPTNSDALIGKAEIMLKKGKWGKSLITRPKKTTEATIASPMTVRFFLRRF